MDSTILKTSKPLWGTCRSPCIPSDIALSRGLKNCLRFASPAPTSLWSLYLAEVEVFFFFFSSSYILPNPLCVS